MSKLILPLLMYKETGSKRKGTKKEKWVVPSWNHLYIIRNNRPILDKWAIEHKEKMRDEAINWVNLNNWEKTEDKKVVVNVSVYWNDAKKKDCHNLDKLLLDALEDVIFDDDANALLRFQDFDLDIENPRIELWFEKGPHFDRKEIAKEQRKYIKKKEKRKRTKVKS